VGRDTWRAGQWGRDRWRGSQRGLDKLRGCLWGRDSGRIFLAKSQDAIELKTA